MDLHALIDNGTLNLNFLEEQYQLYQKNPLAVDASWRAIFAELPLTTSQITAPLTVPSGLPSHSDTLSECQVYALIQAYRTHGHLLADINPIAIDAVQAVSDRKLPPELDIETFGLSKQDLSRSFPTHGLLEASRAPLQEIIDVLQAIYCHKIGIEYMGLHSKEMEEWLQSVVEPIRLRMELSMDQKRIILEQLNRSELFESFLHTKYVGQKRFSLEGAETLIPMMAAVIDDGALVGIDEYIIGMAHRGRLNMLCNIFDKSYGDIFSEFDEGYVPASIEGSGDVKYHKGFYSKVKTLHGHEVRLSLTPNPSHLESVDPVVEGQVKARQIIRGDVEQEKVLPILVHGDGAISGQGIVYETLQFCRLEGYSTGGTIHFVINNQIGFTTVPKDGRSTLYCTDIARVFDAPVFHVNAEDPEGCVTATKLALQLRNKFHCDVFLDINCYRKYGHNEGDEPAFTQPLEYQIIRKKKPIREIYRDALIQQGVYEKSVADALEVDFKSSLQEAMSFKSGSPKEKLKDTNEPVNKNGAIFQPFSTGVPTQKLREIAQRMCSIPDGLTVHPKLLALNAERLAMASGGPKAKPVDWGMAELLAYGSILWDGGDVRLSGQDCCRGTFSHRHALWMDQIKEQGYAPLKHLKEGQGHFYIYNSPLSEYAVLGFEFGYSVASPGTLVLWEAQFGDFANGAQIIIDQFIATCEQKWSQKSAITLLLPHGYEGQGPEHSSGRMERFLTLSGDNNIQVVNPTTPAQLFHLLRRQALRPLAKPLIVFTPKGLLRHPACTSSFDELTEGAFQEILDDPKPPQSIDRLLFCCGRIYYDLVEQREKGEIKGVSIVRIEQLYPLNVERVKEIIGKCKALKECIWVQEEPSNMGAWTFIRPILRDLLPKEIELSYIGRTRSAASATGSHALHKREQAAIMDALKSLGS